MFILVFFITAFAAVISGDYLGVSYYFDDKYFNTFSDRQCVNSKQWDLVNYGNLDVIPPSERRSLLIRSTRNSCTSSFPIVFLNGTLELTVYLRTISKYSGITISVFDEHDEAMVSVRYQRLSRNFVPGWALVQIPIRKYATGYVQISGQSLFNELVIVDSLRYIPDNSTHIQKDEKTQAIFTDQVKSIKPTNGLKEVNEPVQTTYLFSENGNGVIDISEDDIEGSGSGDGETEISTEDPDENTEEPGPETDTEDPDENTEEPGPETDTEDPDENTEEPGPETDTEDPDENTEEPGPETDTEDPDENTEEPGPETDTEDPDENTEEPGPETDTEDPDENTEEPGPETDTEDPDENTEEPGPETDTEDPDENTEEPGPETNTEDPDENTEEPGPETDTEDPDENTEEPGPETDTEDPDENTEEPGPETDTEDPDENTEEPDTEEPNPEEDTDSPNPEDSGFWNTFTITFVSVGAFVVVGLVGVGAYYIGVNRGVSQSPPEPEPLESVEAPRIIPRARSVFSFSESTPYDRFSRYS